MQRAERWVFYDPNLISTDPNREITGKVYFETDERPVPNSFGAASTTASSISSGRV